MRAGLVKGQGGVGQSGVDGRVLAQVAVDECLNTAVGRAEELGEFPPQLTLPGQDWGDNVNVGSARSRRQWQTVERQS